MWKFQSLLFANLPTFTHFAFFWCIFLFFFLNHTSRTHRSLMAIFTHFRENPSIKCSSNYYIVFSKPLKKSIHWRNMNTQRTKTECYFMITQTRLKQQKKIQLVFIDHKLCHIFEWRNFIDHKLCHIFEWSNLQQMIYIGTSLTLRAIFQEIDEQLETKCAR